MDKKRVALIRTNLVDRDPWLEKEIDTLQRGGYAVTLIAWDRERRHASPYAPRKQAGFAHPSDHFPSIDRRIMMAPDSSSIRTVMDFEMPRSERSTSGILA